MGTEDAPDDIAAAIAALEAQRRALGDAVADMAIASLRSRLNAPHRAADPDTTGDTTRAAITAATTANTDAEPEPQLKQATLLFADTVGSTALARRLDPEDVSAVMDDALRRMAAIVSAHHGRVFQYAGDGLLAVFGAGTSHEDDPENAVRAGLALVDEAGHIARQARQDHALDGFDIRVGIHTGPVLIGGGVDHGNTVRGSNVNIAARMEQSAPAGGVRISRDTQRHVRGRFELVEQAPIEVKGVETPLTTYLVQRALPRAFRLDHRGVGGTPTRMVDRVEEAERLRAAYRSLCDAGTRPAGLAVITIVGEAGLGKTRLLREFSAWAAAQPRGVCVFQARASERRTGQPYGVLRDLLTSRLNMLDSDPAPVARDAWLAAMTPLLGAPADAAVLGHLLGLDFSAHEGVRGIVGEARQIRERGFHYAALALRKTAEAGPPVLLLFDDLHWADDGSLDFIQHLQATHADAPLLLVGLTRPTLYERRPGWDGGQREPGRIDLSQLGPGDSDELARELLKRVSDVPPELHRLVTGGAEGNPFYMEELVNMLIDRGAIEASGDWRARPDKLRALTVPSTLTGVLQGRIDALSPALRRTLQQAAVIGHVFWDDALGALGALGGPDAPRVPDGHESLHRRDAALAELMARDFVFALEPSSLAGMREYRFKHHTLHQVCYDSVLKRHKRAAHKTVADWLAARAGATRLDQIAEHYERGGDVPNAVTYWRRAAEAAAGGYANAAALAHADRALALIAPEELAQRYALTLLCVKVLRTQSDRARLSPRLDELEALAERLDDDGLRSEAAEKKARFHSDGGDVLAALKFAQLALEWASPGALEQASRANALIAATLSKLDRAAEAQRHATAGLEQARKAGDLSVEAMILNWMGIDADHRGDPSGAIPLFEQALTLHRQTANRSNEAATLSNLAYARFMLGDYTIAHARFIEAAELCRHTGLRQGEGIVQINLALVQLCRCLADDASNRARVAMQLLNTAGDRSALAAALRVAGHASLALGRHGTAVEQFVSSRDLFDQLGLRHLAIESMAGLALEALSRKDVSEAMGHVEAILARQAAGAGLAGTDEPLRIGLICHQVLAAAGDTRASGVLVHAHTELLLRAQRISDPTQRRGFLEKVPYHRELARLWVELKGR